MPIYKVLPPSPTFVAPALGTPASGVMTNVTGVPIASIVNPYKFSAYKSSAQTVNSGATGKVTFETEEFDTNNNFATSTYTVPITGYYLITTNLGTNAAASQTRRVIDIYVNGAQSKRGNDFFTNALSGSTSASALLSLSVNDTVEIYLTAVGANMVVTVNQASTYFQGFLISA